MSKTIQDCLRKPGAGLAHNAGCFTCAMPKEWCNHGDDIATTSTKCQWKLAIFDLAALFVVGMPNKFDQAIVELGGPGLLSNESIDNAVLGNTDADASVGSWLRQGATLTGGIKVSNFTLVVATLVAESWKQNVV